MKANTKLMLTLLALGASAFVVSAQDNNGLPGGDAPRGPGRHLRGHRPPPPAVVRALDANHDGVIDADEIANAPAELRTLDKNGDGQLTPDEFIGRPPRPPGPRGGDKACPNPPNGRNAGARPDNGPPGPPPDGR